MKQHFLKPLALAILAGTLFTACKDDDEPAATNTITDIVSTNASFSNLKDGVVKAGLATTLAGGTFTVFAPNNTFLSAATVANTNAAALDNIIKYHAISGAKLLAADIRTGVNTSVTTANGDSVFVTKDSRGVFVNGFQVTTADINADNGVIHAIGGLLLPPTGTLSATVVANPNLDSLEKAVLRVSGLTTTLDNNTLTLFAPTNAAFTALLSALRLTDINQIPIATLTSVLGYHVVVGRKFSSDLTAGSQPMFASGSTTIALPASGATILGNGNGGTPSNITAVNIMARRAVIHIIDRVLLN
jgi:uncharacterized surface protein with fasciclin (FAS1) repeats